MLIRSKGFVGSTIGQLVGSTVKSGSTRVDLILLFHEKAPWLIIFQSRMLYTAKRVSLQSWWSGAIWCLVFNLDSICRLCNYLWTKITYNFCFFFCVSYLVVAVSLQSLWSLSLAIMDIYALLVRRSLRNSGIISVFTVGDGVRVFKWSIQAKIACLWLSWTCSSNLVKQQETNLWYVSHCYSFHELKGNCWVE